MARIDLQARRHFLFMYVPIVLIALQSFFKSSLMNFFSQVNLPEELFYWVVRVALALCFLLMLFKGKDWKASVPARPCDRFKDLRSAADPLLTLRAVACLNVFFGHWFLVTFGPHIPPLSRFEHFFRVLVSFSPWCGVWIFFSLSGYLMGKGFVTGRHSISRAGVRVFYFNRVLRIFLFILPRYSWLLFWFLRPRLISDLRLDGRQYFLHCFSISRIMGLLVLCGL